MKIWVIGRGYPTAQNNMLGSFELDQAEMLARRGHTVFYPVADIRSLRRWRKWGFLSNLSNGVNVCVLNVPVGKIPMKARGVLYARVQSRLYRTLERKFGTPDIVHVHFPSIFCYTPFEKLQEKGVRIVGTEHWSQVMTGELPQINRNYLTEHTAKNDALICVSNELAAAVREITRTDRQIRVIPNGVPDGFRYEGDKGDPGVFAFVALGRLIETKRFDLLIGAFASEFPSGASVRLDIIGMGSEYGRLRNLVETLRCGDRVRLLGTMTREEVQNDMRKYKALLCSSSLETFGIPVIEGLACGMPVVCTSAIGYRDLIGPEIGIVVPADDQEALRQAIGSLYRNYRRYDRESIAAFAKARFGEEAVMRRLSEVYESIAVD